MEINVVEDTKTSIRMEMPSEDHTFPNLLRKTLWEDSNLDAAAYRMEHPLKGNPLIMVKTAKGEPRAALKKAASKIEKRAKELANLFSKKVKK